jgi:hypothetical protein
VRKTTQGKGGPAAPAPAAPGGKSRRTPGKAATPTAGEFPDLFALFATPEETAAPPAGTRTRTGRGGATGHRATGAARAGSGAERRPDHAGAGGVSEAHSRSEGGALAARREARPPPSPPAADIFGEEVVAAQTGPQPTASGRARPGRRTGRR